MCALQPRVVTERSDVNVDEFMGLRKRREKLRKREKT